MAIRKRLTLARLGIGTVTFFNLQCAVAFLLSPQRYAPGFEVSGVPGSAFISALGILFCMWNIPYIFALLHPLRNRVSLIESILMQTTGLVGETLLLLNIPFSHPILRQSTLRFIIFDAGGLILLCGAFVLLPNIPKSTPSQGRA